MQPASEFALYPLASRTCALRSSLPAALAAATLMLLPAASVRAQEASAQETDAQVQLLAQSCTSCHSADRGNAIPALYGRKARRLEKYLLGYKAGTRKGTLMPRIARGYTDEQLTELAHFFADNTAAAAVPPVARSASQ